MLEYILYRHKVPILIVTFSFMFIESSIPDRFRSWPGQKTRIGFKYLPLRTIFYEIAAWERRHPCLQFKADSLD